MIKLLIVDDQKGIRRLLQEVFSESGYDIETCANGLRALELITEFDPDLVIMDIKMPGLSGIDVLRRLRATDPKRPVMMMTAYGEQHYVDEAQSLGVVNFINKPFDIDELKAYVGEALFDKDIWVGS
ncbi:MAG: response regulator [Gracilibacteraceae bacterium]|jgi:two-component system response regulator (stage 0 sporulation protein F)|nr:response regulator [Gracilibacteraceae bacterium]